MRADLGIDGVVDTYWRFLYDAEGLALRDEGDHGVDGTIDDVWDYERDDAGNLLVLRQLVGGEVTYLLTSTYDDDGNVLTQAFDGDGDGDLFDTDTFSYTYEDGRLTIEELDFQTDGVLDQRVTYSHDDEGRIASVFYDDRVDSAFDRVDTYTYDGTGDLRIETDDLATPRPVDSVLTETYDQDDHPILLESDDDNDGSIDFRIIFTYEGGRIVRRELDLDADVLDEPDETTTYERDADGRLLSLRTVYDGGSANDWLYTYDYDCEGPRVALLQHRELESLRQRMASDPGRRVETPARSMFPRAARGGADLGRPGHRLPGAPAVQHRR